MSKALTRILDEIIAEGKRRNLTQADICTRAGVGIITFSRAKKQGDIRFSTLTKLANSVGLQLSLSVDIPLVKIIDDGNLFQ